MKSNTNQILFYSLITIVIGGFLIAPLGGILTRAFWFTGTFDPTLLVYTLSSKVVVTAIVNSFIIAALTLFMTIVIAVPMALFVTRYSFAARKLFSYLVLIPMILPPFVGAIGITRIFGQYGLINLLFGLGPVNWLNDANFFVVSLLMALHLFPILYLNISTSLSQINPELVEAAQISGAPWHKVTRDILIPLAMPGFAAGSILVFLWSFTDFGTPLLLGFRQVIAVEIFERVVAVNTDPSGSILVLLLLFSNVLLIFLFKRFFSFDTTSTTRGQRSIPLKKVSLLANILMSAFMFIVLFASVLPHCGIILTAIAKQWYFTPFPTSVTLHYFSQALSNENILQSVKNSLLYSSIATILDVIIGTYFAYMIARDKIKAGWIIDAFIMIPIALPGIILAFGYVASFSGTILDPLKNPVPLLIIGYMVRRLPFCFRSAYAGFIQSGVEFEEAGKMCGATPFRVQRTITLPLIAPHLISGAILAFLFAMLEVSESMILAVKEQFFPLTRYIYALLGKIPDGDSVASALGVICMLALAVGIAIASGLLGKQMGKLFRL